VLLCDLQEATHTNAQGKITIAWYPDHVIGRTRSAHAGAPSGMLMMMMSFICSCRNKIGDELHIYLEEGTYHERLFRGPNTNDIMK
jgi:hypothetical protein